MKRRKKDEAINVLADPTGRPNHTIGPRRFKQSSVLINILGRPNWGLATTTKKKPRSSGY